jgi:hypothetical protein
LQLPPQEHFFFWASAIWFGAFFILDNLSSCQACDHSINLAFRPGDGAGSELDGFREYSIFNKGKESAALVRDAVEDLGKAEKALFLNGFDVCEKGVWRDFFYHGNLLFCCAQRETPVQIKHLEAKKH